MELKLSQIIRHADGYTITHSRAKQRSDKKFVVPLEGGYADRLSIYVTKINKQLDKYQGRVWYTSTQHFLLKNQVLGKRTRSNLPNEIAKFLSAPECDKYTFHLFRRTAATSAADAGSSTEQLVDSFGWKNRSMCQECTSLPASLPSWTLQAGLGGLRLSLKTRGGGGDVDGEGPGGGHQAHAVGDG
jgi:hypothetical protein